MAKQRPVVGRFNDSEDAARAIERLLEKGYTKEEIFVLAEDPDHFADAVAEASRLVELGLSESEAGDVARHMKVGDVLVLVDAGADHYSETLDIVRQLSEQAPPVCRCDEQASKREKVVDYLGQKLFHRDKKRSTETSARGEPVCAECGGIMSSEATRRKADETIRDYAGQPLLRRPPKPKED